MEYFERKITYLRGLCDGSGFSREEGQEGKIFHGMLDVLDDMAAALSHYCEEQKVDIMPISDEDEEYYLFSCICPQCGEEFDIAEETFHEKEEVFCPNCENPIPVGAINPDELKF